MASKPARSASLLVRRRLGLIVGPSATVGPTFVDELNGHLAKAVGAKPGHTYLDTAEEAISRGVTELRIREVVREFTALQKPSAALSALSHAKVTAVLSFAIDRHLEAALQEHANQNPAEQQITTIDDLLQQPPLRTLPVYKLLGSVQRDDFVCSRGDYLARRPMWQHALRAFADRVKDAPVLCIGVSECDWAIEDLIGQMLAYPSCMPSTLIMLDTEPIARNPMLTRRLGGKRLETVSGTVGELVRAAYDARPSTPPAKGLGVASPLATLEDHQEILKVVNLSLASSISKPELQRLLNLLFAPSVPAWDPFAHDLDLPRELSTELLVECQEALAAKNGDMCVAVIGPASAGKSVLLKRCAFELAKAGTPTLWLKPCLQPDGRKQIAEFMKRLAKALGPNRPRIAVFADDPVTLGTVGIADVLAGADAAALEVLVVCSVRTSDWEGRDKSGRAQLVGPIPPRAELFVPGTFTDEELARLPQYLVKVRAAPSLEAAVKMKDEAKGRHASDILASLYWLLPETRASITESVREEYFRLGDVAGLSRILIGQSEHGSEMLQKAYRLVAVAESFRQPVPLEVLVSSLSVSYSDWLETHGVADNAYGLMYVGATVPTEGHEYDETTVYRTRSGVVTDIIVRTINGGASSHAGELEVMRSLLGACTGSNPVYREFCVRLLIRLATIDWIDYANGLRLFDTAIAALPFEDKTLVHHKAIWMRTKGNDPLAALGVLQQALQTKNYPNASRGELDEHIYTSMARATLDGMDRLKINFEEGRVQVLKYLAKARSEVFFNPSAAHVQASLVLRLLEKADRTTPVDFFNLLNGALADIDRGLLLLKAPRALRFEADLEHRDMLGAMKIKLLQRAPFHTDLVVEADGMWTTHKSQEGFVFVARHHYQTASTSDDGGDFKRAFDYAADKLKRVEQSGSVPSAALNEVLVHIYYHWRLQRKQQSATGPIDWSFLESTCGKVVTSTRTSQDPLYTYVLALAKAHIGKWSEAHALFAALRRQNIPRTILRARRDSLRDANGSVHVLQGSVRREGDGGLLYAEAVQTEIKLDERSTWPGDGAIAHARVEFSFAGPLAVSSGTMATVFK